MSKQIKVNMNEELYLSLKQKAFKENITMAALIRNLIKDNLDEVSIIREYKLTDPKLLYHINKIGNNLNQISKKINSMKIVDRLDLVSILVDIQRQINDYRG